MQDPVSESATAGAITPYSVTNCRTQTAGSGYHNFYDCQAMSTNGSVQMAFYISYSIVSGAYDSIISVDSPYVGVYGGTYSGVTLKLVKKTENASGSAWANIIAQVSGQSSGTTYEMRALVGNDTAWTRWEMP